MTPTLIVLAGPPGSGKSTLGALLAERLGVRHLEMDAVRLRILPGCEHTRANRAVAYRAMHLAAEMLLAQGTSVIVNACYGHPEHRQEVEQIAERTKAALAVVECTVPLQTALARCRARQGTHPGVDLTDERVTELTSGYVFWSKGLVVDCTLPIAACLGSIEAYLMSLNRPSLNR